jgi:Methyltransferase domain
MSARANSSVLTRLAWCGRAARLALEDPVEGLDRALLRLAKARATDARREPEADGLWDERLHELLGAGRPCRECAGFREAYDDAIGELEAQGLSVGRGAFGGWDDANPAFASAVWSLCVHLRPRVVVETGVARGVTTRIILEALERAGSGHLWSIDRPPLDPELHPQIGAAVPTRLRERWTLLRGTSRRLLPGLLKRVGPIDLFVHDSLHSDRNLRFELTRAWQAMGGSGALVADDIDQNSAFEGVVEAVPELEKVVVRAEDGRSYFGVAVPARSGSRERRLSAPRSPRPPTRGR